LVTEWPTPFFGLSRVSSGKPQHSGRRSDSGEDGRHFGLGQRQEAFDDARVKLRSARLHESARSLLKR